MSKIKLIIHSLGTTRFTRYSIRLIKNYLLIQNHIPIKKWTAFTTHPAYVIAGPALLERDGAYFTNFIEGNVKYYGKINYSAKN